MRNSMRSVLVLGSGRVVNPFVRYLLDETDLGLIVASLDVDRAADIIGSHPRGSVKALDARDMDALRSLISDPSVSLVASFLPPVYHVNVAKLCIANGKPMLSTSYASDQLKALSREAERKGVLILAEIGLDPGIDHMSAMNTIHNAQNDGKKVLSFRSVCGAIPAPEASLNPFGYKFSWYPEGALSAAKRPAQYLENGREIAISSDSLLEHYSLQYIEGLGYFENYPNMNCLPYLQTYGISTARTIYRGTLRYIGWCETLSKFRKLGFLDEEERDNLEHLSYRQLLEQLTESANQDELTQNLKSRFCIDKESSIMRRLEWLGLLSDTPLPIKHGSVFAILLKTMLKKMSYMRSERDMIVLQDELIVEQPDTQVTERITSTLIDYGVPGGDSAIARTVGIPSAIATKLILQGKIDLVGVHIPTDPMIYKPVLQGLQQQGIVLHEKLEQLVPKNKGVV